MVTILAIFVIVVALAFIVLQRLMQSRMLVGFGDVNPMTSLAQETTKLLGGTGQVVLVTLDSTQFTSARNQMDEFTKAIGTLGGITVAGTVAYTLEQPVQRCSMEARLFFEVVEQYPRVEAIVSLIGAPELSGQELDRIGPDTPKLIVFSSCASNLKPLFEHGLLRLAIVPSGRLPTAHNNRPISPREQFDQLFRIVTRETAASLPN